MPPTADARPTPAAPSQLTPRRLLTAARDFYWGSGLCDDVPALAWFLVAALVPLVLGLTAIASIVLGDYAQAQSIAERAARVLPNEVSDQVVQLLLRTRNDSPVLLAIAVVGMIWTSSGAVGVVERSMSRLLSRERFGAVVGKLRHLGLAAGLATIVVLMVLAGAQATNLRTRLGLTGPALGTVPSLLAVAATIIVCAALYRFCPRSRTSCRAALVGALPAGLGLQLTPILVGYYLRWVAGTTPVEVFLVLSGLLATCYLAALTLLVGAALAVRADRRQSAPRSTPA